jgi:hypothetical protein
MARPILNAGDVYRPDLSLKGKLRRRIVRPLGRPAPPQASSR